MSGDCRVTSLLSSICTTHIYTLEVGSLDPFHAFVCTICTISVGTSRSWPVVALAVSGHVLHNLGRLIARASVPDYRSPAARHFREGCQVERETEQREA